MAVPKTHPGVLYEDDKHHGLSCNPSLHCAQLSTTSIVVAHCQRRLLNKLNAPEDTGELLQLLGAW
jgi:hypothetical protein